MNFSENLQNLRKKAGLSQEELAEKLEVSRQAVSKWETKEAVPDMEKIIAIAELFDCSIDDLVKDTINDVKIKDNNVKPKEEYDKFMDKFSTGIALGVFLILIGVTIMMFIYGLNLESETYKFLGVVAVLIFVIMAVPIFIILGIQNDDMLKKCQNINKDDYLEEEITSFNRKFAVGIAITISIILVGVLVLIILYGLKIFNDDSLMPIAIFMIFITGTVPFLVKLGILKSKYELTNLKGHYQISRETQDKVGKISAVIMLIATIIYFILGFIFQLWQINWLVYPIGGMICGIVAVIFNQD